MAKGNQTDLVPSIEEEGRIVESFDVDMMGRLRPQALFGYLLNSAWSHTRGTAFGQDELSARNLMWVLIKMQISITRLPAWNEQITIRTWGKRKVRLYALRDFTVTSAGEQLVSATSSWMLVDRSSGKPQRLGQEFDRYPWQTGIDEMETILEKVPEPEEGKEVARFRVLFSDIDMNRHVNSTKYLQWIMDSHSYEDLLKTEPRSIELTFLSEALPEDEVTVSSEVSADHEFCSVRRLSDGRELCRAKIGWRLPQAGV